jgi:hypothetical protein
MEQNLSYIRISELVEMTKQGSTRQPSKSDQALGLIEQTVRFIDQMAVEEREEFMNRLTGWMLTDKFESKGYAMLSGLQNYCIADCLSDDPDWSPPANIIAAVRFPGGN